MRFNGEVCYERFRDILIKLGYDVANSSKEEVIDTFVNKIKELSAAVGVTQTVSEVGGKE